MAFNNGGPGGILYKVQLDFEKYIQFTAVPAYLFSPVLSSIKKKNKKKRERMVSKYIRGPLTPVFMLGEGDALGKAKSSDLSFLHH